MNTLHNSNLTTLAIITLALAACDGSEPGYGHNGPELEDLFETKVAGLSDPNARMKIYIEDHDVPACKVSAVWYDDAGKDMDCAATAENITDHVLIKCYTADHGGFDRSRSGVYLSASPECNDPNAGRIRKIYARSGGVLKNVWRFKPYNAWTGIDVYENDIGNNCYEDISIQKLAAVGHPMRVRVNSSVEINGEVCHRTTRKASHDADVLEALDTQSIGSYVSAQNAWTSEVVLGKKEENQFLKFENGSLSFGNTLGGDKRFIVHNLDATSKWHGIQDGDRVSIEHKASGRFVTARPGGVVMQDPWITIGHRDQGLFTSNLRLDYNNRLAFRSATNRGFCTNLNAGLNGFCNGESWRVEYPINLKSKRLGKYFGRDSSSSKLMDNYYTWYMRIVEGGSLSSGRTIRLRTGTDHRFVRYDGYEYFWANADHADDDDAQLTVQSLEGGAYIAVKFGNFRASDSDWNTPNKRVYGTTMTDDRARWEVITP